MHNNLSNSIIPGSEAWIISQIIQDSTQNILYVAEEEEKIDIIAQQLRFFQPNIEIILFPALDCLSYDYISPSPNVTRQRLEALAKLLNNNARYIVICSVSSLYQKTIPKTILQKSVFYLQQNQNINREHIIEYLINNGFKKVETASEVGDFAVRGSIIDLVTPEIENHGIRLDFFGNKIETIKKFDLVTQISSTQLKDIKLIPANEIIFTEETISYFNREFTKLDHDQDNPILKAVQEKRFYAGIEHYLPLFYSETASHLMDYLDNFITVLDPLWQIQLQNIFKKNEHSYQERLIYRHEPYPIVKPEILWHSHSEVESYLTNIQKIVLSSSNLTKTPNFYLDSVTSQKSVLELLKDFKAIKKKTILCCYSTGSLERLKVMLDNHDIFTVKLNNWSESNKVGGKTFGLIILALEKGFQTPEFALVTEQDILGERLSFKGSRNKKKLANVLNELESFSSGELVVHNQHGVGRFDGLETITVSNIPHDCLRIIYYGGDKLFLPVENIDLITKYGSDSNDISLDKLGGVAWQQRKAKIKQKINKIAASLMKIAAERSLKTSIPLVPIKGLYEEFSARFPYPETDDQLTAIEQIEEDLSSGKPMDRLICGDVGFGKTEVAMRAAFIATNNEQERLQVAMIVPTTLLAKQHYQSFQERFRGINIRIAQLSRLLKPKEAASIKEDIAAGKIDIIIGTHALLSKQIKFNNLGLVIIDEEQHFGVTQKEKLKELKSSVHVLLLSATPIPRTLQMSLTGIRELSLIATPPIDRQGVKTFILNFDPLVIREAILREYNRGGKILYVCPRIAHLVDLEKTLKEIIPEIKIVAAHGQMNPEKLDEIIDSFYHGKYDLLLSTSIVESGLDISNANTIFIHNANMFGLSSLYQIRGRVGRGKIKAYAYLILPQDSVFTKFAKQRLQMMQTLDSLGAGFSLASYDMDIRGYGNLIGEEQSGHIKEVGVELYQNMLEEAISTYKNDQQEPSQDTDFSPQINLNLPILIPEQYVSDLSLRLGLYKRTSSLSSEEEIEKFAAEMIDRFGPLPQEFEYLLTTVKIKLKCKRLNIDKLDAGPKGLQLSFYNNYFAKSEKLLAFVLKNPLKVKIKSDHKLVFTQQIEHIDRRIKYINESLHLLEQF